MGSMGMFIGAHASLLISLLNADASNPAYARNPHLSMTGSISIRSSIDGREETISRIQETSSYSTGKVMEAQII